jgi:hypothetical protein
MKFAWDTHLTDLSDRVVKDEQGQPVTLGFLVLQALMAAEKTELSGADKYARYKLADRVMNNGDIDITEAALIKTVVGNVLTPIPVGRVWDLLEHPLGS